MTSAFNIVKGFTLIELLIVITIASILMGFVGPMTIQQLEYAQSKSELLSLKRQLKVISARAFYSGKRIELIFNGKLLTISNASANQAIQKIDFEYLFFEPQRLNFNSKGFVDLSQLKATYRNKELSLNIEEIINSPYQFQQLAKDASIEI